jgi:hypothetical protein
VLVYYKADAIIISSNATFFYHDIAETLLSCRLITPTHSLLGIRLGMAQLNNVGYDNIKSYIASIMFDAEFIIVNG